MLPLPSISRPPTPGPSGCFALQLCLRLLRCCLGSSLRRVLGGLRLFAFCLLLFVFASALCVCAFWLRFWLQASLRLRTRPPEGLVARISPQTNAKLSKHLCLAAVSRTCRCVRPSAAAPRGNTGHVASTRSSKVAIHDKLKWRVVFANCSAVN